MPKAEVKLDRDAVIGATDRRLFGAFVEHLGRCVYGGIFEPDHPQAWNYRGYAQYRLKRYGDALASYEKAVALGRGN